MGRRRRPVDRELLLRGRAPLREGGGRLSPVRPLALLVGRRSVPVGAGAGGDAGREGPARPVLRADAAERVRDRRRLARHRPRRHRLERRDRARRVRARQPFPPGQRPEWRPHAGQRRERRAHLQAAFVRRVLLQPGRHRRRRGAGRGRHAGRRAEGKIDGRHAHEARQPAERSAAHRQGLGRGRRGAHHRRAQPGGDEPPDARGQLADAGPAHPLQARLRASPRCSPSRQWKACSR